MTKNKSVNIIAFFAFIIVVFIFSSKVQAAPQTIPIPKIGISIDGAGTTPTDYVNNIKLLILLTVLTLLPSIIIMMTCFTRIIVTFSFLKSALGVQQAIPSQVLVGLAIFLTIFIMMPTYNELNTNAIKPYMDGKITQDVAIATGSKPLRVFMLKQTRSTDLKFFMDTAKLGADITKDNVPLYVVIPAFTISELKTAFMIGFYIYLPFLIIDLVVSSVLMSMGMFMLSPVMVSMPFKLLLFVMVDGWYLLVKSLIMSFK